MALNIAILAGGALALPLLLSATHIIDVFNGRNVIAAWTPFALLVAIGLGTSGHERVGTTIQSYAKAEAVAFPLERAPDDRNRQRALARPPASV